VTAVLDLLLVAVVLGQIGLLSMRRWAGHIVPDYAGWEPRRILSGQRFRLGLGLLLTLVSSLQLFHKYLPWTKPPEDGPASDRCCCPSPAC
jgi:hypothetical protein